MLEGDFARIVALRNPLSQRAGQAFHMINDLAERFPNTELTILPSQQRFSDHRDMLATRLRIGDVLVAAGGDATAGATLCALADRTVRAQVGIIPVGLLACGGENDLCNTFSGGYFKRPSDVIARGQTVGFRPLSCKIELNDPCQGAVLTFRAAGYIGVNATAIGAHYINATIRHSRAPELVRKARVGLHTLRTAKPVPITYANGDVQSIRELTVPNIRVMGGLAHFKEVGPCDTALHTYTIDEGTSVIRGIKQLLTGTVPHQTLANGRLSFRPAKDVWIQFDGDTVQDFTPGLVSAGSLVTIARFAPEDACFPLIAQPLDYTDIAWPVPVN